MKHKLLETFVGTLFIMSRKIDVWIEALISLDKDDVLHVNESNHVAHELNVKDASDSSKLRFISALERNNIALMDNKVVYKRRIGERYYFMNEFFKVSSRIDSGSKLDDMFHKANNYFKNEKDALEKCRQATELFEIRGIYKK